MSSKIVLGLEGCGLLFKMKLRNLGIDGSRKYHESGAASDVDFVYNESASQILMSYESDIAKFCSKLLNAPDTRFFNHLVQFNDPQFCYLFSECFKEFALHLVFQINRILGTRTDVDYLLEAIADDYVILYQDLKRN